MPIITVANLKGGVAKSSVLFHSSGSLVKRGKKILLVDADPQASISAGYLGVEATWALDPASTIAAIYAGEEPYPERVVRRTGFPGIDLLAGSRHAARYNVPVPEEAPYEAQVCLRDFLGGVRDRYDLILVDTPPNLHMATYSSLAASDYYLVPIVPEDWGSQGFAAVRQSADLVRSKINPGLDLLGIVLTLYAGRRSVHKLFEERLRLGIPGAVFDTPMPISVDYIEALVALKPVTYHKPRGAAAKAVDAIVEELLGRLLSDSNSSPRVASEHLDAPMEAVTWPANSTL
ncbi:MAG: ParA family protein [Planctomycetaceae bacterium]|nr:ParA family protein [Planctomycetaceae bacterium]MBV8610800.1 ParA family protein [Singulisphaera sp.]